MTPPSVQFIPAGGPSLIVHDAFGGSGAMSGRSPDTVDNGSTWDDPQSGVTFTVSSGYAYKSAGNGFSDNCIIDIGQSTDYTIEIDGVCGGQELCGVCIWPDPSGSTTDGIYPRWRNNDGGRFLVTEIDGGIVTALADVTSLGTLGNRVLIAEMSGTTLTASLWDTTQTTLVYQHVVDLSSRGLTPTNYVGIQSAGSASTTVKVYDFKVYA